MTGILPNSAMARLAAVFFVVGGIIGPLARVIGGREDVIGIPTVLTLAAGLGAWFAPWDRWPRAALHPIAAVALLLMSASALTNGTSAGGYGLFFLIVFMWMGVALGPWAPLYWSVPALIAFMAPHWLAGEGAADVVGAIRTLPLCIAVGLAAAWIEHRLRATDAIAQSRATTMAGLVDATLALAATHQVEELAKITAVGAADMYQGDCAVVMLEDDQGLLRAAGDAGFDPPDWSVLGEDRHATMLLAALRDPDGRLQDGEAEALATALGLSGLRALSLRGSADAVGLALIGHRRTPARRDEFIEYVARTLGTQAGLGLERVRAAQALRDESLRDALTGAGNRRAAMAALERLKPGDVVAVIDLDHFKRVNDSYGHAAGDRVLRTLADYIRSSVRTPDEVYRLGGEEFLLVLGGAEAQGLAAVRRIHERWRLQARVATFSAGVVIHGPGETAEHAMARADAALYEAKRLGRDRVVVDATAGSGGEETA